MYNFWPLKLVLTYFMLGTLVIAVSGCHTITRSEFEWCTPTFADIFFLDKIFGPCASFTDKILVVFNCL